MAEIVVLDGFTLNPGDLDWNELQSLGHCVVYERTARAELLRRAIPADILLTNKTVLSGADLPNLPRLKYIGVLATGTNVVDLAAAHARGIPVTHVPAYGTQSVAQTTFALLLELAHHVGHHAQTVRAGRWTRSADFCYWDFPLLELEGLTIGIVGLGRIGRAVAHIAAAFGLKVLACDPLAGVAAPPFVRVVELDSLFRASDIVSLHCPLTSETAGLVNASRLALMKPTALLINTSRGPVVDEPALADALNSGRIAGAALDVLAVEPPPADNVLLGARNCIITPHLSWATRAARARLMKIAVGNVRSFLQGAPQNVVN
ncbi:MAG TPA: D-2-hydroxyacid dehydrogenase [Verrucomicrobiota bacterium]|nr:D-2-hydroxyacid dehydrogenase [Verrucomicrobiota bacterium]HQL77120.1 D-2-hydroxyacid dehydrogenase [Verrucomicrobiota bacterium]